MTAGHLAFEETAMLPPGTVVAVTVRERDGERVMVGPLSRRQSGIRQGSINGRARIVKFWLDAPSGGCVAVFKRTFIGAIEAES